MRENRFSKILFSLAWLVMVVMLGVMLWQLQRDRGVSASIVQTQVMAIFMSETAPVPTHLPSATATFPSATPTSTAIFNPTVLTAMSEVMVNWANQPPALSLSPEDMQNMEALLQIQLANFAIGTISADGRKLAVVHGSPSFLQLLNLNDGTFETITEITKEIDNLVWSPDGRFLAVFYKDNFLEVWDLSTPHLYMQLKLNTLTYKIKRALAWSPNSGYLAAECDSRIICIWNIGNGIEIARIAHEKVADPRQIAWSPDSQSLAALYANMTLFWDLETQHITHLADNLAGNDLVWASDQSRVVVATDVFFRVWNIDQQEPVEISARSAQIDYLVFSPNGRLLAGSDYNAGRVLIWDSETYQEIKVFHLGNDGGEIFWSGDGRRLIHITRKGMITIIGLPSDPLAEVLRPTATPRFSATPTLTRTPRPSRTPTSTITPSATWTASATWTPTAIGTPTPAGH